MTAHQIFENLRDAASVLYDEREAEAISWLLAEELAGVTKTDIIMAREREVERPQDWELILEKLRSGRPAQYIIGYTEFCGLKIAVGDGVLIPRPETEELVEWVKSQELQAQNILDIGTGSGAIAVALAAKMPVAQIRAADVSIEALEIARRNAASHQVLIEFLKADVLEDIAMWDGVWEPESYDIIVSNPPYIPLADLPLIHTNVKEHEPHLALFVPDNDPLVFYRAIAHNALWLLRSGGALYFEIYENFASQMLELLDELGFGKIELRTDMNGKNRMLRCVRK